MTTDGGTTWANITDNLASLFTPGFASNVSPSQERGITLFNNGTATKADDVLLIGGPGGVFRRLAASPPGGIWSQYGVDLPNVLVDSLQYDQLSDTLLAGTFGRGAWTVSSVATTINAAGVMVICGDQDFANEDDTFKLVRDPGDPLLLDVFQNNTTTTPDFQVPLAVVQQIDVFAAGGNDNLIVDSSNGLISVAGGIRYDADHGCPGDTAAGIGGFDRLTLTQNLTGGPAIASDQLAPGAAPGDGISTVNDSTGNVQTVDFQYLEPVVDNVPSPTLDIASRPRIGEPAGRLQRHQL